MWVSSVVISFPHLYSDGFSQEGMHAYGKVFSTKLSVMVHSCDLSAQEAEAGGLLRVQGQPVLHGTYILSLKKQIFSIKWT